MNSTAEYRNLLAEATLSQTLQQEDTEFVHYCSSYPQPNDTETSNRFGIIEIATYSSPVYVESSPFDQSASLIVYGADSHVRALKLDIVTDAGEFDPNYSSQGTFFKIPKFVDIADFSVQGSVSGLSWSPNTYCTPTDDQSNLLKTSDSTDLHFCAICNNNYTIQYFAWNHNQTSSTLLLGHTDYINSVDFNTDPRNDSFHLFSTGDDCTVQIWNLEHQKCITRIPLKSPGIKAKMYHSIPNQILVAQQNGSLVLLDVRSKSTQFTTFLDSEPLIDFDWNPTNPQTFGTLSFNKWNILHWDLRLTSPITITHSNRHPNLKKFKWAHTPQNFFATTSLNPPSIKTWTHSPHSNAIKLTSCDTHNRINGFSWLKNTPCLIYGSTKNLHCILIN